MNKLLHIVLLFVVTVMMILSGYFIVTASLGFYDRWTSYIDKRNELIIEMDKLISVQDSILIELDKQLEEFGHEDQE